MKSRRGCFYVIILIVAMGAVCAVADLGPLGTETIIEDAGGIIDPGSYSVPTSVDWDNDGDMDLLVGYQSNYTGFVRVYLNTGSRFEPTFDGYVQVQSDGADLSVSAYGCLGCFPRVLHWDADGKKDLLVGLADGRLAIFLNVNTDENPRFDAGTYLQAGAAGSKVNIDVGARACPTYVDWDNDGARDLVVGAYDGKVHIYINEGTDTNPDFVTETFAQNSGADLQVPSSRSSPAIVDCNGDGRKDLLTGNTNGQLLLYLNVNTDEAPAFNGYTAVASDGVAIDLAGTPRSRPSVCDWQDDGRPDVLIGSYDGYVRLYQSEPYCAIRPAGDVSGDCVVDWYDFNIVALEWTILDLQVLAESWLECGLLPVWDCP